MDVDRVKNLHAGLKPVTAVYKDTEQRSIQLWKSDKYGLIGTVLKQDGGLDIIPGRRVFNALNFEQTTPNLLKSLEKLSGSLWDLVYDTRQVSLTIWPHMVAAGKEDVRSLVNKKLEILASAQNKAVKQETLPDGRIRYYDQERPSKLQGKTRGNALVTEYNPKTGSVRSWTANFDHSGRITQVHPKNINGREVNRPHYPPTKKELEAKAKSHPEIARTSSIKHFTQTVQQTKLTKSYASTNPQNPIPAKGGASGEIGGVACSVDYIQGLFDGLDSKEHYFYLPIRENALPFSDQELKQILREIAIGIYVHNTVPFFSLHFNQEGEMFPVIHPAYENTLVGRVIAFLDYTMKGYLNGGVFKDSFTDAWAKNPSWSAKKESAMEQLIDFTDYCREQMNGVDKIYLSTEDLGNLQTIMDDSDPNEPEIFSDYTQFTNSFRIISKQNGWPKHDNVLVIDSDFDVFYTILPNADYRKALEAYYREMGHYPKSYLKLKERFEQMKDRIHDHMAKFPLRKEYFAMLGFIGYFASYFSTLKKHRKIPILPPLENVSATTPALFPHLPTKVKEIISLDVNLHQVLNRLSSTEKSVIQHFIEKQPEAEMMLKAILKTHIVAEIERNLNASKKIAFQKALNHEQLNQHINESVNDFLTAISSISDNLKAEKEQVLNIKEQLIKGTYTLSNSEVDEVKQLRRLQKDLNDKKSEYQRTLNFRRYQYGTGMPIPIPYWQRTQLQQNINEIDERLADSPEESFRKAKLEKVNKAVETNEENQRNIYQATLKLLPNKTERLAQFSASFLSLKEDMSHENQTKGKRMLGGCGFHLQEAHVTPSTIAKHVQINHISKILGMDSEKWKLIHDEIGMGALFSLSHDNLPVGVPDDFLWLQNTLQGKDPTSWSNWEKALICLSKPSPEDLLKLVKEVPSLLKETDHRGRSLLHFAAFTENTAFIKELLKLGLSLLAEDKQGNLPIHYAAAGAKCLAAFIEADKHQQTIQAENRNKETPLHIAIQNGQLENVKKLAASGAKNSYSHTGYNTLHVALHHSYVDIALFLLEKKIVGLTDINSLAEEGGTPLMMACELKLLSIVQKLTKEGADISIARKDGVTALEIAIQIDDISIIESLLKLGKPSDQALETLAKEGSVEACISFSKIPEFLSYRNGSNDSLFQIAIRAGNITPFASHFNILPPPVYEEKNKKGETIRQLAIQGGYWSLLPQLTLKKKLNVDEIDALLIHASHFNLKELIQGIHLTPQEREKLIKRAALLGHVEAIPYFLKPEESLKDDLIDALIQWDAIYLFRRYFGTKLSTPQFESFIGNAAAHGSLKVLRYLVSKVKDANIAFDHAWIKMAVKSHKVEALQIVLTLSQDPKVCIKDSPENPLHHAASTGCKKMIDYLISLGVPVDSLDQNGRSPLFYALKSQEQSAVKLLLKKQAKIGPHELCQAACAAPPIWNLVRSAAPSIDLLSANGDTSLNIAIQHGNTQAIENLLKAGANHKLPGQNGWTPTCLAASMGDYQSISLLLGHGVDKEQTQGKNALHWASQRGHPHLIQLLLSHGFEVDQKAINLAIDHLAVLYEFGKASKDYKTTLELFISQLELVSYMTIPSLSKLNETIKNLPLNSPVSYKERAATPLHCLLNKLLELKKFPTEISWFKPFVDSLFEEIHQLIELGLNPNVTDSQGNSLAHSLLLLGKNPKSIPHIDLSLANNDGSTPLHIAAQLENSALLEDNPHINAEDKNGETPLFYALKKERTAQLGQLIQNKADPNHVNHANMTPLSLAVAKESLQAVTVLVEGGAKVNQPFTGDRLTPLLLAVSSENLEITRYLLDNGADPRIANRKGELAIHAAARSGNSALFRLLAERGSPLEMATHQGILPIHFAAQMGHLHILKELHLRGASLNATTQKNLKKQEEPQRCALHFAAGQGKLEVMRFLIEKGGLAKEEEEEEMERPSILADAAASTSSLSSLRKYRFTENPKLLKQAALSSIAYDNPDSLKMIMEWGITPNTNLEHGMQLLHFASMRGAMQSTALLIEQGASPFTINSEGETALEIAAKNNFEQFELLFEYCSYLPEFVIDSKNSRGETLVHLAAKAGNVLHLAALFLAGAAFDEMNVQFATPLDEVLRIHSYVQEATLKQKLFETARFLFICKAEMDEEYKNHPLIQAFRSKVQEGDTSLQRSVLLQDKAALHAFTKMVDVNEQNFEGKTALHYAAIIENESFVVALLKAGANKEIADNQGNIAAALTQNEVIKRILNEGK